MNNEQTKLSDMPVLSQEDADRLAQERIAPNPKDQKSDAEQHINKGYVSNVFEAFRDNKSGAYWVATMKGLIPLAMLLIEVQKSRGNIISLGCAYDPGMGRDTMVCPVYVSCEVHTPAAEYIITLKQETDKQEKTSNTE